MMNWLAILFICFLSCLVSPASSMDVMNETVLDELFDNASKQLANKTQEIKNLNKRDVAGNSEGVFERSMIKTTNESQKAHEDFKISLKVIKLMLNNPETNQTNDSVVRLKAPRRFCPFDLNIKCNFFAKYRSIDGSCNNLKSPLLGKSSTPYKRHLNPEYDDGLDMPRQRSRSGNSLPNPRYVSIMLHQPANSLAKISNLGAIFGQFIDHDFAFTAVTSDSNGKPHKCKCDSVSEDCINIMTPKMDTINFDQKCMKLTRSGASAQNFNCNLKAREQTNIQTHFLDLSHLYGSENEQANKLRLFKGGYLRYKKIPGFRGQYLPSAAKDTCSDETDDWSCFDSGDKRTSQNLLLVGVHNIWMREHNRIARVLRKINRHWNDETLYQEARRINVAVYQNIIYSEWLPIVLGNEVMERNRLHVSRPGRYFTGYNEERDPSLASEFSTAAYRFGHSLITSYYSKCDSDLHIFENITLSTMMFKPAEAYIKGGLDALCRGLLHDSGNKMDNHLTESIQNRLFENMKPTETHRFSLSAVNIMRGRDHGLPGYNRFRKLAGMKGANSFNDLHEIPTDLRQTMEEVYEHVDDIDAFTGGVSEAAIDGALLGPTFASVVARQFRDLKEGDRFYFENGDRDTRFTPGQLDEIKKMTMAGIMCNSLDLDLVQPLAFRPISSANTPMDCMDTPLVDLSKWRE